MAFCLLALLTACNTADLVDLPSQGDGRITLSFTTQGDETRAVDVSSVGAEAKVTHIDLFIVKSDGTQTVKHERLTAPAQGATVTLTSITKKDLQSGTTTIYGVANSTQSADAMAALTTNFKLDDLQEQIERTDHIHLTGAKVEGVPIEGVPEAFLMWGQAEYNGNADITVAQDATGDVDLHIKLVRAAAKVTINFNRETSNDSQLHGFGLPSAYDATSKKITDLNTITYTKAGSYYLRNMPYKSYFAESFFVDNSDKDNYLRKTNEIDYGYYKWTDKSTVTVTAYVYSYEWAVSNSSFENEPTMIVNLPAVQIDNAANKEGTYLDNNYYEIPLRMPKSADPKYDRTDGSNNYLQLKRNHHYVINATVNAPGSKSKFEPMEIKNIHYAEYDWTTTTVNIGGDGGAEYLSLNTNDFEMYKTEKGDGSQTDNTTLRFYSSSPISSVTLTEAYYINKFGNKITVNSGISAEATDDTALVGNIAVTSGGDLKNTIRYMTFKVVNEDGVEQTFTVRHFPLVYITNQQGYYSYRSDFYNSNGNNVGRPTTYEFKGDNIYQICYVDGNYYFTTTRQRGAFWRSKVAVPITEGDNKGQSYYYYYSWDGNDVEMSNNSIQNTRMYHVRLTTTSGDYTLGSPRIADDGITANGVDNAKLVSPSFMIASRLGAVTSTNINWKNNSYNYNTSYNYDEYREVYGEHCKQYVETYKRTKANGETEVVHLDDWRLPTEAELKIIMEIQGTSGQNADAVDYLLNSGYYFSASGRVLNSKMDSQFQSSTAVRCVR